MDVVMERAKAPPPYHAYATITGVFVAGLALSGGLARLLGRNPREQTWLDLATLSAATFKASRTIARDDVTSFLREPFVEGDPRDSEDEHPVQTGGVEQAIGELVTCSRCVGTWAAAGLATTQVLAPRFGRLLTWTLRASQAGTWIFAGTNLQPGSSFARGGIEADATTPSSPRGTQVIGTIPNIFGTGRDAEMSYYELPNGAKVFAAGAFTLAERAFMPAVKQVLENLWIRLANEAASGPAGPVGTVSPPG